MIVPTRGDRLDTFQSLVEVGLLINSRVIVVNTNPLFRPPEGTTTIEDFGPLNIQRWWNRGLALASSLGIDVACVLNDDISISGAELQTLCEGLLSQNASIATPGKGLELFSGHFPLSRRITGSLWAIRPVDDLRACEDFRWHFGDDDLDIRARFYRRGLLTVPVAYAHRHKQYADRLTPELHSLVAMDRLTFRRKYPLHSLARWSLAKTQGRVGKGIRCLINGYGHCREQS